MSKSALYEASFDSLILDYLITHGRQGALDISADLDQSPMDVINALHRLQEQGRVAHIKYPRLPFWPIPSMS